MMQLSLFIAASSLCIGSFLNLLGYRLVRNQSIVASSSCPSCKTTIAWYDNIPLISWIALRGFCRHCKNPISWLYPCIELFTSMVIISLWAFLPANYFLPYLIFCSALIVCIRSDLETMLISRYTTLFLIPIALAFAYAGKLPISITESLFAAMSGYAILRTIALLFYWHTKKEGLGQGDADLLALIGAFTGFLGAWFSLLIGSIAGTLVGLLYLFFTKSGKDTRIPFGPFLALGALSYLFLGPWLASLFFGI